MGLFSSKKKNLRDNNKTEQFKSLREESQAFSETERPKRRSSSRNNRSTKTCTNANLQPNVAQSPQTVQPRKKKPSNQSPSESTIPKPKEKMQQKESDALKGGLAKPPPGNQMSSSHTRKTNDHAMQKQIYKPRKAPPPPVTRSIEYQDEKQIYGDQFSNRSKNKSGLQLVETEKQKNIGDTGEKIKDNLSQERLYLESNDTQPSQTNRLYTKHYKFNSSSRNLPDDLDNTEIEEQENRGMQTKTRIGSNNISNQNQETAGYYSFSSSISSSQSGYSPSNVTSTIGKFNISSSQNQQSSKHYSQQTHYNVHNESESRKFEINSKKFATDGLNNFTKINEDIRNAKFIYFEKKIDVFMKYIKEAEFNKNLHQLENIETDVDNLKSELQIISRENGLIISDRHITLENNLILIKQKISDVKEHLEMKATYDKDLDNIETEISSIESHGINNKNYQTQKRQLGQIKKKLHSFDEVDDDIKRRKEQIAYSIDNLEIYCTTVEIEDRVNHCRLKLNHGITNSEAYEFQQNFIQLKHEVIQLPVPNEQISNKKYAICRKIEQSLEELERKAAENLPNKNSEIIWKKLNDIAKGIETIKNTLNSKNYQSEKVNFAKLKHKLARIEELADGIQLNKDQIVRDIDCLEKLFTTIEAEDILYQVEQKYNTVCQRPRPATSNSCHKYKEDLNHLKDEVNQISNVNQNLLAKKKSILFNIEHSLQELHNKVPCNETLQAVKMKIQSIKNGVNKYNYQSEKAKFNEVVILFESMEKLEVYEPLIGDLIDGIKYLEKVFARIESEENFDQVCQLGQTDEVNRQENQEEPMYSQVEYEDGECDLLDAIQNKLRGLNELAKEAETNKNWKRLESIETSIGCLRKDLKKVVVKNFTVERRKTSLEKSLVEIEKTVHIVGRQIYEQEQKCLQELEYIKERIAKIKSMLNDQNYEPLWQKFVDCKFKLESIELSTNNILPKKQEVNGAIVNLQKHFETIHLLYTLNKLEYNSRINFNQYSDTTNSDDYVTQIHEIYNYYIEHITNIPDLNRTVSEKKKSVLTSINNVYMQKVNEYNNKRAHNEQNNRARQVQVETATEATEDQSLEILDVHQYFRDDFDFNSLNGLDKVKQIRTVGEWAETFEDNVKNFKEAKYSLEYFVLDEKLMRFIEHLDKIKCKDEPDALQEKVKVIEEIKKLQGILDEQAVED